MTLDDLPSMVRSMRAAQKKYFQSRGTNDLGISRDWERRVDAALAKLLEGPGLFDEAPHEKA